MTQPIPHVAARPQVTPTAKASEPPKDAAEAKDTAAPSTPSAAPVSKTTVTISSAARAAMLEATETPAQTAQEARGNDRQAQRLLAKEEAVKQLQTKT